MNKQNEFIKAELEKMYAIALLEYHDMNLLSGDIKSRNEQRQKALKVLIEKLKG